MNVGGLEVNEGGGVVGGKDVFWEDVEVSHCSLRWTLCHSLTMVEFCGEKFIGAGAKIEAPRG